MELASSPTEEILPKIPHPPPILVIGGVGRRGRPIGLNTFQSYGMLYHVASKQKI